MEEQKKRIVLSRGKYLQGRIAPRHPITYYANPNICARRIKTRGPTGNGKLFTGVFDDD